MTAICDNSDRLLREIAGEGYSYRCFLFSMLVALRYGGQRQMADKDKVDRELVDAGWETDGSFSGYLAIGESGDLCVLVHRGAREADEPAYELYDADKHLSYRVHEVPTPERAAVLLEEHGEPPEEE